MKRLAFVSIFLLVLGLVVGIACAPPAAAEFEVSTLVISPSTAAPGEEVTISVDVENIGGEEGSYTVTLTVDDEEVATEEVTLAAGATETVTFTISRDVEAVYAIEVDGLTGTLTVTTAPPVTYLTHTDTENGFAVDYPEDWAEDTAIAADKEAHVAFKSPTAEDDFYPYLYVIEIALPMPLTVSAVFGMMDGLAGQWSDYFPGYSHVSHEDTTVDDLAAIVHIFTCDDGKVKQLLVVKGSDLWEVICFTTEDTFDAYGSMFGDIIASFTFLD